MQAIILVFFYLLYAAASIAVFWAIWFVVIPAVLRPLREQLRALRERRRSH
jgi:hypothetical protein